MATLRSKFAKSSFRMSREETAKESHVQSVHKHNEETVESLAGLIAKEELLNSFLAPIIHHRSDSAETLVTPAEDNSITVDTIETPIVTETKEIKLSEEPQSIDLATLPTELFTLIAMSSGFVGAMTLRKTCSRFRKILSEKYSWVGFTSRSPDVIHSVVHVETKLHQFDQIMFCKWPMGGIMVPSIVHRTFLEEYDFLGGLSLKVQASGRVRSEFFEHRERLPCYIEDVQARMSSGSLPPVLTSDESPVGGLRVPHSCGECAHYDQLEIIKSEFVHSSLADGDALENEYAIDSNHKLTVRVTSISGVFGYQNDVPSVHVRIASLNGVPLSKGMHHFYLTYVL